MWWMPVATGDLNYGGVERESGDTDRSTVVTDEYENISDFSAK